jgi:hypothetical protein
MPPQETKLKAQINNYKAKGGILYLLGPDGWLFHPL